ncbi:MAG: pyrroloquinoline quinone biosynthesis protein PqqE [Candidatus Berkiella sp.]
MQMVGSTANKQNIPLWIMFELSYRCPLQCPYCSNPMEFAAYKNELQTDEWIRVMKEAREMGAVQLGFSGGEPLVRQDLEILIKAAHDLGFYTNLITSSVGMDEKRLIAIKNAGINSIQISFQSSNKDQNDFLAGTKSFDHKVAMAKKVKELGISLTFNIVLHRQNIDDLANHLDFAISLGSDYIELANTQYLGFAFKNKEALLPLREQIKSAEKVTKQYQEKYQNQPKIFFVVADYFQNRPTPCMNGWGTTFITFTPDGYVLPCHSARVLPNVTFPNVRESDVKTIWEDSSLFNKFRGYDWMKEPCRSCPEKTIDFGGCHCQAYLLTNDACMADPVCDLSPDHHLVLEAIERAAKAPFEQPLVYRNTKNSRLISTPIKIKKND